MDSKWDKSRCFPVLRLQFRWRFGHEYGMVPKNAALSKEDPRDSELVSHLN